MKNEDFKSWFNKQVSKGQLQAYRDNPEHLINVTIANREKGKRDDWGWKNEEKRNIDLIKAHIKIGQNHNGKTFLEKKVEWWLKKQNIKYESQKYYNNGVRKFWVDFYLPDYNIIIEADGVYWHNAKDDAIRDAELKKVFTGRILHFKEKDIRDNFDVCASQLEDIVTFQNCFIDVEVKSVSIVKLEKQRFVYNLEVKDDNTYTANKIVVHNCSICESLQGKTFTLDEAEGVIPRHPMCRCIWLPLIIENKNLL